MGHIAINVTPKFNTAFLSSEEEEMMAIYFARFYNLYAL
jgi:hypothetical protein